MRCCVLTKPSTTPKVGLEVANGCPLHDRSAARHHRAIDAMRKRVLLPISDVCGVLQGGILRRLWRSSDPVRHAQAVPLQDALRPCLDLHLPDKIGDLQPIPHLKGRIDCPQDESTTGINRPSSSLSLRRACRSMGGGFLFPPVSDFPRLAVFVFPSLASSVGPFAI